MTATLITDIRAVADHLEQRRQEGRYACLSDANRLRELADQVEQHIDPVARHARAICGLNPAPTSVNAGPL